MLPWVAKMLLFSLENPGIDPGTSHMQSGRSTIWANPPDRVRPSIGTYDRNYCDLADLEIYMIYITVSTRSSCVVFG